MNTQQVTAILLCALVGSTLGHEFLRAKRFAPEPRSSRLPSPFDDRSLAAHQNKCRIVCEPDNNDEEGRLKLIYNETSHMLGIYNDTAEVGLLIGINTSLVGVFDGSNGAVFILNLKAETGVYIAGGLTKISWISSQSTFEIFFSKLTSLQVFLNLKIGQTFSFSGISTETLNILDKLMHHFSAVQRRTNSNALTFLVKISFTITSVLNGSLKGLFEGAGNGPIPIHGDLIWLGGVFEGLDALFSSVPGGLAAVLAAKIKFDLTILFGASSGLELFVNILFAFAAKGKISLLAGLLSSNEKILAIIVQLGGNVSTGVTGLFKVILHIYLLTSNKIKLQVFLHVLSEYSASRTSGETLDLDIYIQGLLRVIEISGGSSSSNLTVFVTFVKSLQAGKLVNGNLNISEIITILVKGRVSNALHLVVSVLLKITVVVGFGITVTIPALLLYLLTQLTTAAGIILLKALGIKINISMSSGDIVGQLLKELNITSIREVVSGKFSVKKLTEAFPPFGYIFNNVSAALRSSSKGTISLIHIVNSSYSIQTEILAFIKGLVGLTPTTQKPTITTTSHSNGGGLGGFVGGIFGSNGSISGSGSGGGSGGGSGSGSGGGSGSISVIGSANSSGHVVGNGSDNGSVGFGGSW